MVDNRLVKSSALTAKAKNGNVSGSDFTRFVILLAGKTPTASRLLGSTGAMASKAATVEPGTAVVTVSCCTTAEGCLSGSTLGSLRQVQLAKSSEIATTRYFIMPPADPY
ncbi:MAG: hypothetical protein BWX66_02045 [Deltaproteobacteria bacterium ADurb.Bin058]|nr:MAG: hypothetical protein BWX66_02045 [Deltaproteobacteria bacterium ADurb.Bin058]